MSPRGNGHRGAPRREDPFFIGWAGVPASLAPFLRRLAAGAVALFAAVAFLVATTQDDPGAGSFRWDLGPQTVTGVLTLDPYPVLHVSETGTFPAGTALLLSGPGKRGVAGEAEELGGHVVAATGIPLSRGDLLMLQVRGGDAGLERAGSRAPLPPSSDLGRWRLTGEICDGKCYAGAMLPGEGLAHKACANLCLRGGVPPVFVATGAVDGSAFFLLAGPDGGPLPEALHVRTGELVELEGRVRRLGAMPVLEVDPETVRPPR